MKNTAYFLILLCLIAVGCADPKPISAPRDANTVMPLLVNFTPELGVDYIKTTLGEADKDMGGMIRSFFYALDDGTTVNVKITIPGVGAPSDEPSKVLCIERKGFGIDEIEEIYRDPKYPARKY